MKAIEKTAVESGYADVNGIRLHYATAGKGPLMLFVHGFPEFWGAWEKQLAEFGRDHQAVAPDMRGYNLSAKPEKIEDYAVGELVADLKGLARHLGHRRMILVAHDWGGAAAWSLATRHPDMVAKLIIINSPHPALFARELLENPAQQKASDYMLALRDPGVEAVLAEDGYRRLFAAMVTAGSRWEMTRAEKGRYVTAWNRPGALRGSLNYYRISPLYPPRSDEDRQRLKAIAALPREVFAVKVPTLVIWGEADAALLPGLLDGLEDYIDDLTVQRIPDGSHWVIHEQPQNVNALIRRFLENKGAQRR